MKMTAIERPSATDRLPYGFGPGTRSPRNLDRLVIRIFDISLSSIALIFLAPLMCAVALFVGIGNRGPILFAHSRLGKGGASFPCLKFRTMVVDAEKRLAELLANDPAKRLLWERDHKLHDDPRVTWLGNFLRKTSIDELPQLFNVLRGEMSLVGPRPITKSEVLRYGRYFKSYCLVKPGITGLWQVSGRSDVNYRRRVALDTLFVRNSGALFYIIIIARTVPAVLLGKGSY